MDTALWGVDDSEWRAAQTAVLIQRKADGLSSSYPVLAITDQAIDANTQRLQLWGQREVRPMMIEEWMGMVLSLSDEQLLLEIIRLLPANWSVVLEGRGRRQ